MFGLILLVLAVIGLTVSARLKVFDAPAAGTDRSGRRGDAGETLEPRRNRTPNHIVRWVSTGLGALGVIFLVLSSFFALDPGQAAVLRGQFTRAVDGIETSEGLHTKAPWDDVIEFDVRNQQVKYIADGRTTDNAGGLPDGAQITVQDKEGVSANIDVTVQYSIARDAVGDIYRVYRDEEGLRQKLILNDIRSVVRDVPGNFTTLEVLTDRPAVRAAVVKALEAKWEGKGLIVEDVSLQEIRYPDTVTTAFADAQQAQIAVTTEQAKLDATKVSAQQKVVQAQAEADANALLNSSLTPSILQQRYLDTLKELAAAGNLVITDGTNSQILVQR
ncbi:prohibitin family protein [Naasia aerilata]|uniref:prohibitin family protein n=1 Tax=Naasia aerilata TaxID=1162966 RepID=UPI0025729BC6|nr:prohibitin family protein [Naasia aerilata]